MSNALTSRCESANNIKVNINLHFLFMSIITSEKFPQGLRSKFHYCVLCVLILEPLIWARLVGPVCPNPDLVGLSYDFWSLFKKNAF